MGGIVARKRPHGLGSRRPHRRDRGVSVATDHREPHPSGPWIGSALVIAVAASIAMAPYPVRGQSPLDGERPSALGVTPPAAIAVRIEAPSLVLGAPASEVSFSVRLVTSGTLPANTYVRIQGLPPQVSLSDGHAIAPGAWAVPIAALPDLRIVIPAGVAGRSEVAISLIGIDSGIIADARSMLVVAGAALAGVPDAPQPAAPPSTAAPKPKSEPEPEPKLAPGVAAVPVPPPVVTATPASPPLAPPAPAGPPPQAASPPQPAPAQAPAAPPSPPVERPPPAVAAAIPPPPPVAKAPAIQTPPTIAIPSPEALERGRSFHARGRTLLDGGDIASARLLFQRAAEAGHWEGALAMGTTYDAGELSRRRTVGVRPDAAEARRWYERARELGGGENAERYLARLLSQ